MNSQGEVSDAAACNPTSDQRRLIAIDGDGVMLDYNAAFPVAWKAAFGTALRERDPRAYHAHERWDVKPLSAAQQASLRSAFDSTFWSGLPALPGALDACRALVAAGHELVCVTAIEPRHEKARLHNLLSLGFPIQSVIATGHHDGPRSPKAAAIETLRPAAFVDDYVGYLAGLPGSVHLALIESGATGSPNVGMPLTHVHSTHAHLQDFARFWLAGGRDTRGA